MSPLLADHAPPFWWDGRTNPGEKWRREISKAVRSARIGVLLISANFLDSDFIRNEELPYLLEAAERSEVTLFWILVSNCLYDHTPIVHYQAAHDISRPLDSLKPSARNDVLVEICRKLHRELTATYAHEYL